MKTRIIVSLYYLSYYKKVRKEIFSIFRNIDYLLIFVDNNGNLNNDAKTSDHVFWIKGSNIGGEFSAWDEGYDFLKKRNLISDNDIVIFINDTFCHHRFFTFYDKFLYRKAITNCFNNKKGIYGEINSIGVTFCINYIPFNSWISSYLFFGFDQEINKLIPLDTASKMNSEVMHHIKMNLQYQKVKIPFFSENLNQHINNWFFSKSKSGWYKSGRVSADTLFLKIKAIINEKMLSYKALENNVNICSVYDSKISSVYNSIRNRIFKWVKCVFNTVCLIRIY